MKYRLPTAVLSVTVAVTLITSVFALAPAFAQTHKAVAQAHKTAVTYRATKAATPHLGSYVDLYQNPDGQINGSTYIFNPVVNFVDRMAFDFAHMRTVSQVNAIGFYNLVQMTDPQRDALFADLEANRQKAIVRIEYYNAPTFDFDNNDPSHADVNSVIAHYTSDDRIHGYTGLIPYLIKNNKLKDIAYFAVNMPVDDGIVADHFKSPTYSNARDNPAWASSQVTYADNVINRLRGVLGGPAAAKLYLSVFYGWDQSYPTPSYAGVG
jgi:trimeric autotransporter adhesin